MKEGKIIDGKKYYYIGHWMNKTKAESEAKLIRRKGVRVRILPIGNAYSLWINYE